mmetsp:Transcript_24288/g.37486  ORF Transcript_24288/g.37486 Transcript_24288/m.37486 type:complete len:131 (+) Transcript_24288:1559-1951(+)
MSPSRAGEDDSIKPNADLNPMRYASINESTRLQKHASAVGPEAATFERGSGSEPRVELVPEDDGFKTTKTLQYSVKPPSRMGSEKRASRMNPPKHFQVLKDGRVSILIDNHVPPSAPKRDQHSKGGKQED